MSVSPAGCNAPPPYQPHDDANVTVRVSDDGVLTLTFDNGDIGDDNRNNHDHDYGGGSDRNSFMNFLAFMFPGIFGGDQGGGRDCGGSAHGSNGSHNHTEGNGGTDGTDGADHDDYTGSGGPQTAEQVAQQAAFGFLNSTAFNEAFPDGNITKERLTEIAENKDGKFDEQAVNGAKSLLDNKLAFDVLDRADGAGKLDGSAAKSTLESAAGLTPGRDALKTIMNDKSAMKHMHKHLEPKDLDWILKDPNVSAETKAAAQYLKDHPEVFTDIETAHKGGKADGKASWNDLNEYLAQGDRGVSEDTHGNQRRE